MYFKNGYSKFATAFALAVGVGYAAGAQANSNKGRFIGAGMASWYGDEMAIDKKNGKPVFNKTASGDTFNPDWISAAHKTLDLPSCIRVETKNGNSLLVTVNDRGPYARNRVLDLSEAAAHELGVASQGHFHVRMYDTGMDRCPR